MRRTRAASAGPRGIAARATLIVLGLVASGMAAAQAPPPRAPAPQDIVVTGRVEPRSDWKRADADHAVLYSQGGAGELRRVAAGIDRLHALMWRLYRRTPAADDAAKIRIVLVDTPGRLRTLGLDDAAMQEGPFQPVFVAARHYRAGEDGAVLIVPRSDLMIDLNTPRRFEDECDEYHADGGEGLCGRAVAYHPPITRSWEAALYAAYAQHFLLTYLPDVYPRWYLDGVGALFSTIAVGAKGAIDYARPPVGYGEVFRSYGTPDVADVVSGRYLDADRQAARWSPYGAWLLVHYLTYSPLKPARAQQFAAYMAAIRRGEAPARAATAFGDLRTLGREIEAYAKRQIAYAVAKPPATAAAEPLVVTLSATGGALVDAELELEAYRAAPDGDAATDRLARLRDRLAPLPADPEAQRIAAEAACGRGPPAACLAATDRILARAPDDVRALAWRGAALADAAIAGAAADRPARLAEARRTIARAIALDPRAPKAQIARFQSFARAGEPVPDDAMRGLTEVVRAAPAAPAPRLLLGRELVRRGDAELARRLLRPVTDGAYDLPERQAARALFATGG